MLIQLSLLDSPLLWSIPSPDLRSGVGNAGGAILGNIQPSLLLQDRSDCFELLSTFSTCLFVPAMLKWTLLKLCVCFFSFLSEEKIVLSGI